MFFGGGEMSWISIVLDSSDVFQMIVVLLCHVLNACSIKCQESDATSFHCLTKKLEDT